VLSLQNPDVLADAVDDRITALGSEAELLETVEYYLGHGRKPDLVADSLHIHRGTLYYRLRKFEDATGLDLDSGTDRLSIQLSLEALKLLRAPNWHHASP
jgi:DNA-binding PucR family transcriptional regulator